MSDVKTQRIECPHCGHHIYIELDTSGGDQDYVEDCSACCNPIHLQLHIDDLHEKVELRVDADDEQVY